LIVIVDEHDSASEALQAFHIQLRSSQSRDKDDARVQTRVESGIGEGAFSAGTTEGLTAGLTAVRGTRVFIVRVMGEGPVWNFELRTLMQAALRH
jgi:hypothetical protein